MKMAVFPFNMWITFPFIYLKFDSLVHLFIEFRQSKKNHSKKAYTNKHTYIRNVVNL